MNFDHKKKPGQLCMYAFGSDTRYYGDGQLYPAVIGHVWSDGSVCLFVGGVFFDNVLIVEKSDPEPGQACWSQRQIEQWAAEAEFDALKAYYD